MTKQELISRLEKELDNKLGGNYNLAINTAILFAKQLDDTCPECEKVRAYIISSIMRNLNKEKI